MKIYILLTGLIWVIQSGFIPTPILCEEDTRKTAIIEGINDFFNSYASKDIEGMLKWISPYYTQFRIEMKNAAEDIQNIDEFSCGNLNLLKYKYQDNNRLKVKFTIECNGVNPETSTNFKQVIAKEVRFIKDEDGTWKVVEAEDIDASTIKQDLGE